MAGGKVTEPLVSVIIPAYNSEKYIADAVNSVLAQTYQNLEIIVVDDASKDDTFNVVSNIITDRELHAVKKKENSGAAASRNQGYGMAKGSLIKFLDADDIINPEMIAEQVALVENNDCIISAKWGRFYNDDITTFKPSPEECWQTIPSVEWICSSWKNSRSMTNPGIFLIPKTVIEKAGRWDESLSLLDDIEYFTKTILAAGKVIFSEVSVLYYRSGVTTSLSSQLSEKHALSGYRAVSQSVKCLLSYENSERTRLLGANALQELMYRFYPGFNSICAALKSEIKQLGGSSLEWQASGKARALSKFIGWKPVKVMQETTKKIRGWRQ
jgi:GT2 family glycosyltransferase